MCNVSKCDKIKYEIQYHSALIDVFERDFEEVGVYIVPPHCTLPTTTFANISLTL